jgi:hypothetical protein
VHPEAGAEGVAQPGPDRRRQRGDVALERPVLGEVLADGRHQLGAPPVERSRDRRTLALEGVGAVDEDRADLGAGLGAAGLGRGEILEEEAARRAQRARGDVADREALGGRPAVVDDEQPDREAGDQQHGADPDRARGQAGERGAEAFERGHRDLGAGPSARRVAAASPRWRASSRS